MQSRSSCAKTATVRMFSSVPARKIRTAISLRFAAISFLMGRAPGAEKPGTAFGFDSRAGAFADGRAGVWDVVRVLVRWRGIRREARDLGRRLPEVKR